MKSRGYGDDDVEVDRLIHDLPEKWDGYKPIKFRIITSKNEASWILKRILEEIDRGFISAQISAKRSHSVELVVVLDPITSPVIAVSMGYLLGEIKSRLIRWNRRRGRGDDY